MESGGLQEKQESSKEGRQGVRYYLTKYQILINTGAITKITNKPMNHNNIFRKCPKHVWELAMYWKIHQGRRMSYSINCTRTIGFL